MATATRGHGLMVRVQQLEADFPTIEKALLLQTNHSSFFSNSGCNRVFGTTSSCRSICAGHNRLGHVLFCLEEEEEVKILKKKGSWESEYDVQVCSVETECPQEEVFSRTCTTNKVLIKLKQLQFMEMHQLRMQI